MWAAWRPHPFTFVKNKVAQPATGTVARGMAEHRFPVLTHSKVQKSTCRVPWVTDQRETRVCVCVRTCACA